MLHSITDSYPIVFGGGGRHKPHSKEYRDFQTKWGFIGTLYNAIDEKIEKIGEIYQVHLNDFLQYLSYMIEKAEMEDIEDSFQQKRREAQRKR